MVSCLKASYANMVLSVVQIKMRPLITVFTFTVLVVWSLAVALMARTHVGSFKVGASTICADLWFQAFIHILKNAA